MGSRMMGWMVRRRTLFLVVVPVAAAFVARPHAWLYALGLALAAAGQAVRLWSAGHIQKGERLASDGPYAWVRNPLYLGSLLITLGWAAMCGRAEAAVVLVGCFFLTHWPTILSEERFLRERFGPEFEEYYRRVPRLFPRPRRVRPAPLPDGASNAPLPDGASNAPGGFSWRRAIAVNGEGRGALGVALLAMVYGARLWL